MTDKEILLSCPFCGTYRARAFHVPVPDDDWFVKCLDCDNSMPPTRTMVHSRDEAIAAWNGAKAHARIAALEAIIAAGRAGLLDSAASDLNETLTKAIIAHRDEEKL